MVKTGVAGRRTTGGRGREGVIGTDTEIEIMEVCAQRGVQSTEYRVQRISILHLSFVIGHLSLVICHWTTMYRRTVRCSPFWTTT